MILSAAVFAGFLAGLVRSWHGNRRLQLPDLSLKWLVVFAFLPQWIVFGLPMTRRVVSDELAAATLITTQAILLVFGWYNRRHAGIWALELGLAANLLVITLNGGLMPISPETASRVYPEFPEGSWQVMERLGTGKDVVLPVADTRLWTLSDRFFLPLWGAYRVAFSIGDLFIAFGAFWLLWEIGAGKEQCDDRLRQEVSPG
jgi:hypothetical protein